METTDAGARENGNARRRPMRLRSAAVLTAVAMGAGTTAIATGDTSAATAHHGVTAHAGSFLACEVTDTGGINDESFNQSAYAGLKAAAAANSAIKYTYLGSTSTANYVPYINQFVNKKCGIIITVGFDMATATIAAAKAHPNQRFAIVDYPNLPPMLNNLLGLNYSTNQDAFLGGYLAAAMSKSHVVGTFGGQDIPPVTIYMDGWVAGVRYYDQKNHAKVKVLGWTPAKVRKAASYAGTGIFTNNFTDQGLGKTDTTTLIAQGADVIFPVAGAVGLGAAAAVKQAGAGHIMEWVDTDGCLSAKNYCSLFVTSVTKGIGQSVQSAVLAAASKKFKGGNYSGTLANGGVALSPLHTFATKVPASVQSALATIKAGIISGKISVDPNKYPAP